MAARPLRGLVPRKTNKGMCAPLGNNFPRGSNSCGFTCFCVAAGKTSQPCVRHNGVERPKVSFIAVNASAPLGKYEAKR